MSTPDAPTAAWIYHAENDDGVPVRVDVYVRVHDEHGTLPVGGAHVSPAEISQINAVVSGILSRARGEE